MDIILVHLGNPTPKFQEVCIRQIEHFTKARILLCRNENDFSNAKAEEFKTHSYLQEFGMNGFWSYAALRLFYVEEVMAKYGLKTALHIENDNLIYDDPEHTMMAEFCGEAVGLTQLTDDELSAGVMYVGSRGALATITEKMTDLVKQGKDALQAKYGPTWLQEMRLLKIIYDENPGLIKLLPTLPNGSAHIFDCASWGQWVGGTFQDPGIPYAGSHHIVGRELISYRELAKYDVVWCNKTPWAIECKTKALTKLFNLHIHSKQLERWKSYE
jgi:hypothetical protein